MTRRNNDNNPSFHIAVAGVYKVLANIPALIYDVRRGITESFFITLTISLLLGQSRYYPPRKTKYIWRITCRKYQGNHYRGRPA